MFPHIMDELKHAARWYFENSAKNYVWSPRPLNPASHEEHKK